MKLVDDWLIWMWKMMSKERLEKAKDFLSFMTRVASERELDEHIKDRIETQRWLIERTKLAEDLEGDAVNIYRANHNFSRRIDILEKQNKRYREALRKISSPINTTTFGEIFKVKQIARKALEESE